MELLSYFMKRLLNYCQSHFQNRSFPASLCIYYYIVFWIWPQRFRSVCTIAISPTYKTFLPLPPPPHKLWLQEILNVHLASFLTLTSQHLGQALNHYCISSYPWHIVSNWSQLSIIRLSLYGFRRMRSFLINLKFFDKITLKIDIDSS